MFPTFYSHSRKKRQNDVEIKGQFFSNGKYSGVYAGAFQPDGDYLYNSIGFRGTGDVNAVSPYWLKASGQGWEPEVRSRHGQKGLFIR